VSHPAARVRATASSMKARTRGARWRLRSQTREREAGGMGGPRSTRTRRPPAHRRRRDELREHADPGAGLEHAREGLVVVHRDVGAGPEPAGVGAVVGRHGHAGARLGEHGREGMVRDESRAREHAEVDGAQPPRDEVVPALEGRGVRPERDVEALLHELDHPVAEAELHADVGVAPAVRGDELGGEPGVAEVRGAAHAEPAPGRGVCIRQVPLCIGDLPERGGGSGRRGPARPRTGRNRGPSGPAGRSRAPPPGGRRAGSRWTSAPPAGGPPPRRSRTPRRARRLPDR
jgi:hypothetical protein